MRFTFLETIPHTFTNSAMGDSMSNGLLTHLRSLLTLVVDLAITVDISFTNHLVNLGVGQLLA